MQGACSVNHGTRHAIATGCVCDGCRLMRLVYEHQDQTQHQSPSTRRRRATAARRASVPLVDGTAWGAIINAMLAQGHTENELATYCGVGAHTIGDLAAGKRKVQARTVPKLRRLLDLLPSEEA